jgi:hypothetical protein
MKKILIILLLVSFKLSAQDTITIDSICAGISTDSATIYGLERTMYYNICDTSNTTIWDYIYYRDSAGVRTFALPYCINDTRVAINLWYVVSKRNIQLQMIRRNEIWLKKP